MKVQSWTGNEFVSINEVIQFLNELLQIDSDAINKLLSLRVSCNKELDKHETVQTFAAPVKGVTADDGPKTIPVVGILGIINGMFGVNSDNFGAIMIMIERKTGKAVKFGLVDAERMLDFKKQEVAFKARQMIKKALPPLNRPKNNKNVPNDRRLGDEKKKEDSEDS